MLSKRETNTAFLTHISAFASFVFPFGGVLAPLVMWSVNKDRSEYVDKNGLEAVNFNISYVLYVTVLSIITFPFAFGSFFRNIKRIDDLEHFNFDFDFGDGGFLGLFGILSVGTIISVIIFIRFVLAVVAAIKASRGEVYKYPLTIQFIK